MAHGFLSYQDTRGEVDYLGGIINAVKNYLDNREKKEQVADMVAAKIEVEDKETAALEAGKSAPRLPVGTQKMLTGGSYSKLAGRNPKALPGAVATNPEVRGGAITKMGFGGKRLKPEGFVGDQVIDISATPVNDSNQIVQAIDRLTFVSMNLLSATKEQTAIAQRQQLFFEKLARKDKASIEEAELERGKDLSGNVSYSPSRLASGRGPAGLLGPGPGATQKAIQSFGSSIVKRAPQALRAGAGLAAKGGLMSVKQAGKIRGTLQASRVGAGVAKRLSEAAIAKTLATGGPRAIQRVKEAQAAASKLPKNNIKKTPKRIGVDPSKIGETLFPDATSKTAAAQYKKLRAQGLSEADALKRAFPEMAGEIAEVGKTAGVSTVAGARAGDAVPTAVRQGDDVIKGALGAADGPLAKMLGKGLGKSILKKIPVIAGVAGIVFGIQRALEGDFLGAGLEITSGILGATGVGGLAGAGIDAFLLARDFGATPFASGGIITQPTAGLVGEAGTEGVFPLEGSRGRKTFEMFGNAFVDAQKRRIREVAQIQSAGLEEFAKKADNGLFGWFGNLFGGGGNDDTPSSPNTGNGRAWWDPLGLFTGNDGVESRTPMVGPPPPLPPITGTDSVSMARSLIVDKEGFRETPYWDVNAYRAGYGSDTYTLADGTVKRVQQGVNITRADADRDIDRRISTEFMPEARRAVGPDIWDNLPAAAQAALTSIAYNYGSVPERVTRVAKSTNGNIEAIAGAVEGLKGDDKGINAGRRQHEADMIRSSAGQAAASLTPSIGDQSSVSPAAAETGNPLSAASQQVATAAFTPQAAPIIQNFYGSDAAKNSGGNMPATVAFGISSRDTGTDPFAEFRIRSLA